MRYSFYNSWTRGKYGADFAGKSAWNTLRSDLQDLMFMFFCSYFLWRLWDEQKAKEKKKKWTTRKRHRGSIQATETVCSSSIYLGLYVLRIAQAKLSLDYVERVNNMGPWIPHPTFTGTTTTTTSHDHQPLRSLARSLSFLLHHLNFPWFASVLEESITHSICVQVKPREQRATSAVSRQTFRHVFFLRQPSLYCVTTPLLFRLVRVCISEPSHSLQGKQINTYCIPRLAILDFCDSSRTHNDTPSSDLYNFFWPTKTPRPPCNETRFR